MKDYDRHRFMTEPHLWLSKNNDGDIYINVDRVELIDDRTIMRYRRSLCDTLCQIDLVLIGRLNTDAIPSRDKIETKLRINKRSDGIISINDIDLRDIKTEALIRDRRTIHKALLKIDSSMTSRVEFIAKNLLCEEQNLSLQKQTTMKQTRFKKVPFNLELAKKITNKDVKGRIVTEDGHEVRIICYDYRHFGGKNRLVALIDLGDHELALAYNNEGKEIDNREKFAIHLEVPTYHKDYSNFKPCKWQPCLVRDNDKEDWNISVCKGRNLAGEAIFFPFGCTYEHCLPLSKATERLVNTRMSYEELIQELDAESTATTKNE